MFWVPLPIYSLNNIKVGDDDFFDFVGLEMTDKVPFDVLRELTYKKWSYFVVFIFNLINVILPEMSLSCIIGLLYFLDSFRFTDSHQSDWVRYLMKFSGSLNFA